MEAQSRVTTPKPPVSTACFIVLDGLDGCGKSTQAARVVAALEERGRKVLHTREPGGTDVGEAVRAVLLDPAVKANATAELFLYQAARAQLAGAVIAPALADDVDVVCERWHFATMAYQGGGGGANARHIAETSSIATRGVEPHVAVLLDIDAEVSHARIKRALDRMERRDLAYRRRVAATFRAQFEGKAPSRVIVDADRSVDEVFDDVWRAVEHVFAR